MESREDYTASTWMKSKAKVWERLGSQTKCISVPKSMTTLVNLYLLALTPISQSALNFTITIQEDKLAMFWFHIVILNGMVVNPSNYPIRVSQPKPNVTY